MNQPRPRRINYLRWGLLAAALFFLAMLLIPRSSGSPQIDISRVFEMAQDGQIAKIEVSGDLLNVTDEAGQTFESRKESSVSILEVLQQRGIDTGAGGIQI